MSWEIFFVVGLLIFALASFLLEKIPADQTALTVFAVILAAGLLPGDNSLPKIDDLLTVFANPAPLTIAAMFILSAALDKCGAIKSLAAELGRVASSLGYPCFDRGRRRRLRGRGVEALRDPRPALSGDLLTETLSNNATVVLMTPLALSLGAELGVDPRPFVIATCIAASASFSTPIGYQTNTYVYGVAGYRFRDFTRAGLPLNMVYFLVSVFLIPRLWSFEAL